MNNFYVYVLLDPRTEEKHEYYIDDIKICFDYKPFYVGKGKRWRIGQHFSKYNLKKNTYKNNKILNILNAGYKPIGIKVFENLSEENAYNLEIKLISIIGLNNLTNKNAGGLGQNSESITGEKNPMFGKHPIPWNKGQHGIIKNPNKGKSLEEIYGKEKALEIKQKQSLKRKGKTWEEYFGVEKARMAKIKRSEQRRGYKHTPNTIEKMKKSSTPEIILNRKNAMMKKRQNNFDNDMMKYRNQINQYLQFGYTDLEIIRRINDISRFRLKKMIFLLKNNLNSDYYFQQ